MDENRVNPFIPQVYTYQVKVKVSRVQLFATPWTEKSMELSRPKYWSG